MVVRVKDDQSESTDYAASERVEIGSSSIPHIARAASRRASPPYVRPRRCPREDVAHLGLHGPTVHLGLRRYALLHRLVQPSDDHRCHIHHVHALRSIMASKAGRCVEGIRIRLKSRTRTRLHVHLRLKYFSQDMERFCRGRFKLPQEYSLPVLVSSQVLMFNQVRQHVRLLQSLPALAGGQIPIRRHTPRR